MRKEKVKELSGVPKNQQADLEEVSWTAGGPAWVPWLWYSGYLESCIKQTVLWPEPSALSLSGNSSRSLVLCACCSSSSPNPTCPELCKLQRSMCSFYLLTGLLSGSTLGFVLGEWSQIGYPLTLESRWWQSYYPALSCPPIKEF